MSEVKILLVDDREDNLLSIESILASDDYRFVKARSGSDALKILLKEQDFTLILMDVKMPGLSGFETASMIYEREKLKKIPIIFITAYSYSEEKVYQGYKAGAVDYIYKPIKPQLLKAKVSVFVDLYRKTQELTEKELKLKTINRSLEKEIKEHKRSEEQVKDLNRKLMENIRTLENANTELERFAYVASHDLQEPLRKIQTYGDLLQAKHSNTLNEEGLHFVDRMQKGSMRLQKLIKDILVYSRLTSSNEFFSRADLNEILQETLIDLEIKIKESNARIDSAKLPELFVNPGQIRQLFQNIISNALKFARPGVPPQMKITCWQDNGYWNISITDNGIGFDELYADQIFVLFKRLNDKSEGTGIGLAICKKIMDQHKGFIQAKSREGEGSTFLISLPAGLDTKAANGHETAQLEIPELKK